MLLRRFEPVHSIHRFREEMDRLLGNLNVELPFLSPFGCAGRCGYPALNIWEDKDALYAQAEVPGLNMEELEVLVQGGELTIKGAYKPVAPSDAVSHRRERPAGEFSRVVRLPVEIDSDRVEASLADGVLSLKLPKAEAARSRKITVKRV